MMHAVAEENAAAPEGGAEVLLRRREQRYVKMSIPPPFVAHQRNFRKLVEMMIGGKDLDQLSHGTIAFPS